MFEFCYGGCSKIDMLVNVQVYPEGTHFMIPWFERPVIYDVRARPHLVESTSGSRDMLLGFACSHREMVLVSNS